ncbi:MAG: EAL domain-containing protein [Bradyrhizobium sp.]|uniref:putative bifunctional diguanylate cyclase/phosphodiesterase n=1 Tax=Bradyrhizobium sp. TaxID=376 RepID=UPI00239F461A|nr:EAL domain-containing protein [Bradyrhizobium sp.]MDE2241445.1 EAL domain-containing protein [Bradyrhizobium sp.]
MRKLFERQLAKATGPSGELDINVLANLVTSAYDEAERDRQRTDRAISLMIEEVHQTNARLLDAFTIVPEGLVLLNAEGKYVLYNQRFVELYDPMRDTIRVGADFSDTIRAALRRNYYPDAAGQEGAWLAERLSRPRKEHYRTEQRISGDRWLRVDERSTADGGSIGIHVDITDLKHREESLKERSEQLTEAQRMGKIGDWAYELGAAHVRWSAQVFKLLGFAADSFSPKREAVMSMYVGDGAKRVLQAQAEIVRTRGDKSVDVQIRKSDGSIGEFVVTSKLMLGRNDRIIGFSGTIQDISERKAAERALESLAYYDTLTGLANRALFQHKVSDALARCAESGAQMALLLLDLDRFKEVNDTLGHDSGDELLATIARLISRVLGGDNFGFRLGGDEFAIAVMDPTDRQSVARIAAEVIAALSAPITLDRGEVRIGASIGIAVAPDDGANLVDILRSADVALYRAKENGRGCFKFFEPDMNASVQKKMVLSRDLRLAISTSKGLKLWYQPQVDLATERVNGFEAHVRWEHPDLGYVSPNEFMPVARNSHLLRDIGLWSLHEAARQARAWIDAGETPREIAVSVSTMQICHRDFVDDVALVLNNVHLPPQYLCLEVTEGLLIDNVVDRIRAVLRELKRLGVTLLLDDFGTKHSSLNYLLQLPFDRIKIDRIFKDEASNSRRAQKLLRGIIAVGHDLGMKTSVKGVESMEEIGILRKLGCDMVQGDAILPPSPAAESLSYAHSAASGRNRGARSTDTRRKAGLG